MTSFFISCIPPKATSQQKGESVIGGRIVHFKKAHVKRAENDLVSLLIAYRPADLPDYSTGALAVSVSLTYPYRKSERKALVKAQAVIPCDKRPDVDNLVKMIMDGLTRCAYWGDDGQVARLLIEKQWGPRPGIAITICKWSGVSWE